MPISKPEALSPVGPKTLEPKTGSGYPENVNIRVLLCSLFALSGNASAVVRPLALAPTQLLAPSAPVVLGLGAVASQL